MKEADFSLVRMLLFTSTNQVLILLKITTCFCDFICTSLKCGGWSFCSIGITVIDSIASKICTGLLSSLQLLAPGCVSRRRISTWTNAPAPTSATRPHSHPVKTQQAAHRNKSAPKDVSCPLCLLDPKAAFPVQDFVQRVAELHRTSGFQRKFEVPPNFLLVASPA